MPALVFCGRRWFIGSDDFVLPAFCDLFYRLAWLIAVLAVYLKNNEILNLECEEGFHLQLYLYGAFAILSLIVCIDIALAHYSKAGPILDNSGARKFVPLCLYCRLFLHLVEIVWTVVGTIGISDGSLTCSFAGEIGLLIKGLVICNWAILIIGLFLVYLIFNPIGAYKYTVEDNGIANPVLIKEWQKKFLFWTWLFSGNRMLRKEALEEVGHLFSSMLEDVDLVPSDAIAGFIILGWKTAELKQKRLKNENANSKIVDKSDFSSTGQKQSIEWPTTEKWNSIPVLFHFEKYALAAYGWELFIAGHSELSKPIKNLWANSFCCGCLPARNHPINVEGDNCCFLNTSAVKSATQIENSDIVYISFQNPLFEVPFFVALDHATKSIVIAFRGSMSTNDILMDHNGMALPVSVPHLPDSFTAHHGILRCARIMKGKLDSLKLLPKLCATHPDYNLVLTGHSLGAATATILSLLLKNEYPAIKCYAFAPPGGILSLDAAKFCESYVTSVIYGDDFIARFGLFSIETVKYQIMEVLNECKTPKYRIFLREFYRWIFGGSQNIEYKEDINLQEPCSSSSESQITVISAEGDKIKKNSGDLAVYIHPDNSPEENTIVKQPSSISPVPTVKKLQPFEQLYPPGKILYIIGKESCDSDQIDSKDKSGSRCTARWADRSEFREFLITSRMLYDHVPLRMYKSLHYLTIRYIDSMGSDANSCNSPEVEYIFKKKCKSVR